MNPGPVCSDLGERWRGERSQLAAAPPEGVVSVGRTHVEQTFPLSRLADHAQLPVLTLPDRHLRQVTGNTEVRFHLVLGQAHLWVQTLTSQ